MRAHMKKYASILAVLLPFSALTIPIWADEPTESTATEQQPFWQGSLGLSYLATSGNTDTSSLGLKLEMTRRPTPWGVELKVVADQAEEDDRLTAERFFTGVRGTRQLSIRPEVFFGISFEQDEFSGIDLRTLVESGLTLPAIEGEQQQLVIDLGLTWTDEDRLEPDPDIESLGAVLALHWSYKLSEGASLSQDLNVFPSFEDSHDWRAESLSTLTAALTDRLGVQLGYEIRYRNRPVGDRGDTDRTAKASLVIKL